MAKPLSLPAEFETPEPASESGVRVRLTKSSSVSVPAEDPILASLKRAPLVPMTDEERALLDELPAEGIRWIPDDQFAVPHASAD